MPLGLRELLGLARWHATRSGVRHAALLGQGERAHTPQGFPQGGRATLAPGDQGPSTWRPALHRAATAPQPPQPPLSLGVCSHTDPAWGPGGGWCRPGLHRGVPGAQREAPAFFSHVPGPERWIPKAGSPPPNTATRCPTEAHSGPLGQPAPHPRHDRETQTPGTSSASGLPPGLTAPAETLSLPLFSPSLSLPLGPTRCHPFPGERARTEAFSPLLDPSDARSATCPHKSLSVPAGSPGTPARAH